ncbi:MAG: hypothetical protein K6C97_06680 [Treponema sp.]|nr:hypothetical protein [Treponema sp.]
MKKLLAVLTVAFVFVVSSFAFDLGDIKGTWKDSNWDANWTFSADGKIILTDGAGSEVFTFTDANVKDYKLDANTSGVSISFYCAETERAYKFTKPITLNSDLDMHINPDWTDKDYDVTITFQK